MKKILNLFLLSTIGLLSVIFVQAEEPDFTTYKLDFHQVLVEDAQGLINKTFGSGTVDIKRGEELLASLNWTEWLASKKEVKIFGWVPFYWPRNLIVAYEYYLQCWNKICGSIYDFWPWMKGSDDQNNIDTVLNLFVKWAKCIDIYGCNSALQPQWKYWKSYYTFFVPDVTPTSLRLGQSIVEGRIKFYHGIYAIWEKDLQVVSLDPRDDWLTRKDLKKRLVSLVDFSTHSKTIPLILDRAKSEKKPFQCTKVEENTRTIYSHSLNWEVLPEIIKTSLPQTTYYEPSCIWIPWEKVLVLWSYALNNFGNIDMLTGRVLMSREPFDANENYLEYPLQ